MPRRGLALLLLLLAATGGGAGARIHAALPPGTVVDGSYASKALRGTIHYAVYLPAGYADGDTRYPVIYLLHGLPGDMDSYRSIGFITRPVEASGLPAIVVGVQGARKGDTDPEWHDWGPGRNWATATAKELVSVIDRRYRTIPTRRARALIGISAGGYGATLIGIHHPSVYSVIESWSGYFYATDPAGTGPMDLGSKEANDSANAHTLVPQMKTAFTRYRHTLYGFYVGTDDKLFLQENRTFDRELTAAHVTHDYAEYSGGHSAAFWREHETEWVTDALERLDAPR
ncbi:MAG: alpha/beta hydrolase [Gaiellaceae bacterium]